MPWLFKTEPDTFSFADLLAAPGQMTLWEGVRNYQARNFLRAAKVGDSVLIYHSSTQPAGVAGLAVISREAAPDPTQFDPDNPYHDSKATPDTPRWDAVEVRAVQAAARYVTLAELRAEPQLAGLRLLQRGNRLSVVPVSDLELTIILKLAGITVPEIVPATAPVKEPR